MKYVICLESLCGPGVVLGEEPKPFIYSSWYEANKDIAEGELLGAHVMPVTQDSTGDWVNEMGQNFSEIARLQCQ